MIEGKHRGQKYLSSRGTTDKKQCEKNVNMLQDAIINCHSGGDGCSAEA